ncbi:MAG: hypothetical protein ACLFSZ_08950 [Puniceicoccaceae bacterium]
MAAREPRPANKAMAMKVIMETKGKPRLLPRGSFLFSGIGLRHVRNSRRSPSQA